MKKNALARCWRFARPHSKGLMFSFLAGLGMMAAGLAIAPIVGAAVDDLRPPDPNINLLLPLLLLVVGVLETVCAYLRRYTAARASVAMEQDIRNELYAHLQRLPVSFHDGWQSGQLLSRAMSDLSTIRRFIGFGLMFLILNGLQFLLVLFLMVRLNAGLALFTALMAVPIAWFTWLFDRKYSETSRRVQDDQGDLATIIEESATGIRIIKAFGRGRERRELFRASADLLHTSSVRAAKLRATFWTVLHALPGVNLAVVLAIGGPAVIEGTLTAGGLAAFIVYLQQLTWPIRSVGWLLANAEEARTAAERLFEVLDTEPEIADRPTSVPVERATGHVQFENVSFAYPGTRGTVLENVNLDVLPGETLALVGVTGSGKTTLVSLVSRLYDATSGSVKLDGRDVRDIELGSLRRHVGVAFEDAGLFSMSVRENLLLGYPEATDDQIRRALETANATFAYDLPWGLDTRIGEQGYSLSGGQRQRLALARAVIPQPQVLVLDDPLSAVDVHTEALIEAALERVLEGVTALLVVHRPSTLALADRVALLDGGTIVATGAHADLMETVPLYRNILSQEAEEVAR